VVVDALLLSGLDLTIPPDVRRERLSLRTRHQERVFLRDLSEVRPLDYCVHRHDCSSNLGHLVPRPMECSGACEARVEKRWLLAARATQSWIDWPHAAARSVHTEELLEPGR